MRAVTTVIALLLAVVVGTAERASAGDVPPAGRSAAVAGTTIACYPTPKVHPRDCTVFGLPGTVTRNARIVLSRMQWSAWGARTAVGRGRLLRRGRQVRIRVVASQRFSGTLAEHYYSRLTLIDTAGHRQRVNLEEITESS